MQLGYCVLHSLILIVSLSTDAFAASVAYGAGGICIPWRSAAVISVVCSGMLTAALAVGDLLQGLLPQAFVRWICFALLASIGVVRLFDSALKGYIRRHQKLRMRFAASSLQFVLTVYADAETADADHSKLLSTREAATLAIALSLDGLAVGVGAAMVDLGLVIPAGLSLLVTAGAIPLGCSLGRRLQKALPFDLSLLSALLLLLMALLRLLA